MMEIVAGRRLAQRMSSSNDIQTRIDNLDLGLFTVESQSCPEDKWSWLALQRMTRRRAHSYVYLEIGSHLGGSIQTHFLDPRCRQLYSIDKRPLDQPDDRGWRARYNGNSTARMLDNLRQLDADRISKITCFDQDARDVSRENIPEAADLCFIDGEHTRDAVISDFVFCERVSSPDAVIYFHDDWVIAPALRRIIEELKTRDREFTAFKLLGGTFAIALGKAPMLTDKTLKKIASDGYEFLERLKPHR